MRGVEVASRFLLPANLHRRFYSAVFWTDHEEHPLVFRGSFKERGIVLVISTFLDRGLTTAAEIPTLTPPFSTPSSLGVDPRSPHNDRRMCHDVRDARPRRYAAQDGDRLW
jgi:hypothetical protein